MHLIIIYSQKFSRTKSRLFWIRWPYNYDTLVYPIILSMIQKRKPKIWRRILLILIILGIYIFTKKITINAKVTVEPGDNAGKIFSELSRIEQLKMKIYLYMHRDISFSKLEAGNYTFSGSYTKSELVQQILKGSEKDYIRLTILEGRSIYDIDEALARKWYITGGDFVNYVTNTNNITQLQTSYKFLENSALWILNSELKTLEGFLYPDTYNIDKNRPLIPQLVSKQLQTFNTRVRSKLSNPTGFYKTMVLASVVEKEERNNDNKPTVAGIFLKRLELWMKIDADITLCYGLKTSYTDCTPSVIARNVSDANNKYNTRAVRWLPPTTICNPTRESINAVVNPQSSDYLYYLHDMDGNIHYGETLEEHNANKAKYLN